MKFTVKGWVVDDELEPNAFIGNQVLDGVGIVIDYPKFIVTYIVVEGGLKVPFRVKTNSLLCVRKVIIDRIITLEPGITAMVPALWKPLLTDRSFMFNSTYPAAMHVVINAKTPRSLMLKNMAKSLIIIIKRTRLGNISESTDSGYFVIFFKKGFKIFVVALVLAGQAAAGFIADMAGNVIVNSSLIAIFAVNIEFDLIPIIIAVAVNEAIPQVSISVSIIDIGTGVPDVTITEIPQDALIIAIFVPFSASETPMFDYVFNIIAELGNFADRGLGEPPPVDLEDPKLRIPRFYIFMGIGRPENLLEEITDEGVYIYAESKELAIKLYRLVIKNRRLWRDQGVIKIAEED